MIPLRDTIRSATTPWVNYALIATNVAVFLGQIHVQRDLEETAAREVMDEVHQKGVPVSTYRREIAEAIQVRSEELYAEWMKEWGLVPGEVASKGGAGEFVTFLTCMFLHANWLHLLGNMLYLYIFGDNVEDRLGHARYLAYYLSCGLGAAAAQFGIAPGSDIPMVGASGAIAGALGGYLVLFPHAKVLTIVPIFYFVQLIEVPAPVFLVFWFIFQNLAPAALSSPELGGVAYWAHIGGFAAGAAICWAFRSRLLERPVISRHPARTRYDWGGHSRTPWA